MYIYIYMRVYPALNYPLWELFPLTTSTEGRDSFGQKQTVSRAAVAETFQSVQGMEAQSPRPQLQLTTAGALALPSVDSACRDSGPGPWNPALWKTRVRVEVGRAVPDEAHRGGQSHRTEAPSPAQMSRGSGPTSPLSRWRCHPPWLVPKSSHTFGTEVF